jgi:DnaJ-domain-containing protein 1
MGLATRLLRLLRAELNALAERAVRGDRAREEGGAEPLAEDEVPLGWDREIAQHYANLELPYGADWPTVKRQYRRLMARYHPDRHQKDPEKAAVANRLAAELTRAYEALEAHLHRR